MFAGWDSVRRMEKRVAVKSENGDGKLDRGTLDCRRCDRELVRDGEGLVVDRAYLSKAAGMTIARQKE